MKNKLKKIMRFIPGLKQVWNYITLSRNNIELYNVKNGVLELKKKYRSYFFTGILASAALHLTIAGIFFVSAGLEESNDTENKTRLREINIVELPPAPVNESRETFVPPPEVPEKKVTSLPKKDIQALEPEPVKKQAAEEQTVKTQQELEQVNTPVSKDGDTTDVLYSGELGYVEEKKVEEKIEEKKVEIPEVDNKNYSSFEVEKAPDAVNLAQVKGSIDYPAVAVQAGIEGRVTVKVLVGKQGKVIDVGKISGPEVFHDEVADKVRELEFTPGLQNGKPVNVWVTVPFNFSLN